MKCKIAIIILAGSLLISVGAVYHMYPYYKAVKSDTRCKIIPANRLNGIGVIICEDNK